MAMNNPAVDSENVPRGIEPRYGGLGHLELHVNLAAGARHRGDGARGQIYPADGVVLGVGYIERVCIRQGDSLRSEEARHLERPVAETGLRRSDHMLHVPLETGHHDTVVVAVADEQSPTHIVGQDLAWEQQGPRHRFELGADREWATVELTPRFEGGEQPRDGRYRTVRTALRQSVDPQPCRPDRSP